MILSVSNSLFAESLREYQQRQCEKGNAESCKRAAAMLEGEHHADQIVEPGDTFAETVDRSIREEENRPILKTAYMDVLDSYFMSEAENGVKRAVSKDILKILCREFS